MGLRPWRSSENKMFTFWMLVAIARSSVAIDAICTFAGDGNGEVTGEVHLFNAHEDSETEIHGAVFGLNPGLHGFHIHAEGDLGDNCKNALGHFNPAGSTMALLATRCATLVILAILTWM